MPEAATAAHPPGAAAEADPLPTNTQGAARDNATAPNPGATAAAAAAARLAALPLRANASLLQTVPEPGTVTQEPLYDVALPRGPCGREGARGPQGGPGCAGAKGEPGVPGQHGEPGPAGASPGTALCTFSGFLTSADAVYLVPGGKEPVPANSAGAAAPRFLVPRCAPVLGGVVGGAGEARGMVSLGVYVEGSGEPVAQLAVGPRARCVRQRVGAALPPGASVFVMASASSAATAGSPLWVAVTLQWQQQQA
jgi:hypothetical protein